MGDDIANLLHVDADDYQEQRMAAWRQGYEQGKEETRRALKAKVDGERSRIRRKQLRILVVLASAIGNIDSPSLRHEIRRLAAKFDASTRSPRSTTKGGGG